MIAPMRSSTTDTVWELGSVVANRFVLQIHLGRGRYGEVYEALDRSLSDPQLGQEQHVALHLLHDHIRNQTRLLQKLENSYLQPHFWSHPNVVKVSGFGCDRGKYFLVTELLKGASLRFILDEASPERLSQEESFAVLRGVGDALKYAHAKGAIHGDIRPEKVFVTEEFAVKVLDLLPASLARTVPFFVEDRAPNGLATPDQRDDVYGLACLAYELLSGRHPFNTNSPLEALNAGFVPAPITGLAQQRWDALARALALRREQRTASVVEFLTQLGVTGLEKLRPAPRDPVPDAPNAATVAQPAVASYTDVPILGDYSIPEGFPARAQPRPGADAQPEHAFLARRRTHDFDPYPEFPGRREPRESRTGLRLGALALIAAIGVATYLNYALVRSRAVDLLAAAAAFVEDVAPQSTADIGTDVPRGAESVPADGVVGTGLGLLDFGVSPETPPATAEVALHSPAAHSDGAAAQPARFEFDAGRVTVSEDRAIAPAVIRRAGGKLGPASVVWWTSDGTAVADEDYANLGRRVETFAAGEEALTIHVPIVVDSVAEERESFYLNLGESQRPGRRLEPLAQIEVVIDDDDS